MSNEIKVFENEEFGSVRTMVIDGEPWFVGKDIADALGYAKSRNALAQHVDIEDKTQALIQGGCSSGTQKTIIINESGLYSLILSSKLETAKKFKRWVTSEVLPSIRKHGAYLTDETLSRVSENTDEAERLFRELKEEKLRAKNLQKENSELEELVSKLKQTNEDLNFDISLLENRTAALEPKADYYDEIMKSSRLITVSEIASEYGMSAKQFNHLLSKLDVQFKSNETWYLCQEYEGKGFVKTDVRKCFDYRYRFFRSYVHTRWTQKGVEFLYRFLAEYGILPVHETDGINIIQIG